MRQVPAPPLGAPLVAEGSWVLLRDWVRYFTSLAQGLNNAAQQVGRVALTAQGAAIAATAVPTPGLTTGRYRVTYYARITRAAGVNSSLTVTLTWTDGAVACSFSGAAIVGNTTATYQTGGLTIRADVDTTITYATAYVSNGVPTMQYQLDVVVDAIP